MPTVVPVVEPLAPASAAAFAKLSFEAGGGACTVHVRDAGDASTLPAASVARTSNVCAPTATPLKSRGDVHAPHTPASRRHSNVAASLAPNVKLAVVAVTVPDGPPVIVVSGAVVSTAQLREAGDASTLPAASVARASNVCVPAATETAEGEVQAAHAAPSRRHWK